MELEGDLLDALTEVFNIGIGRAADSLSRMVGDEVLLSVPSLVIGDRQTVLASLDWPLDQATTAIQQTFDGPFGGEALLIFPESGSLDLVRCMLPVGQEALDLTEMEEEALAEVGNIILNACLSTVADLLRVELRAAVPVYRAGPLAGLLDEELMGNQRVMALRIAFNLKSREIAGNVLFLQSIESSLAFQRAVGELLGGDAA